MSRWLSLVAFGLLALALWLLPEADPGRLAALQAHTLLAGEVEPEGEPGNVEPGEVTHAEALVRALADAADADPTAPDPTAPDPTAPDETDETERPAATGEPDPSRAAGGTRELRRLTLALGGVRVVPPEGLAIDLGAHELARRSLVRGLREGAERAGVELAIEGERTPAAGGLSATVAFDPAAGRLALSVSGPPLAAAGLAPLEFATDDWRAPRRTSLLPPLVAIALAILLRRPVFSLLAGAYAAGVLLAHAAGASAGGSLLFGADVLVTDLLWNELADNSRLEIVGFVVFMLSMVGVLTRSGGIRGMMDVVARRAKSARGTQIAAYLIGLLVFFDDYANTILCGSTMRPLADRFRVAREKLAYIVDSTAAPVAGLSLLSTWIAFEVSTFSAQLPAAGLSPTQGYEVFIQSLPYRFYCVFTLVLVGFIVVTGRDLGPMLAAERRARRTGAVVRPGAKPMVGKDATDLAAAEGVTPSAIAGLVPILLFVAVTLFVILSTGGAFAGGAGHLLELEGISAVLGEANVYSALLYGSLAGFAAACAFAWKAGLRGEIPRAAWTTLRSMGVAIAILYLAWMLGRACRDDYLGTATYLTALLGDRLSPEFLPAVLFLLAALVAFSTGSSWSTMTILLPLVVGLAYGLGSQSQFLGPESGMLLVLMSIGAVLEGAIFGDHCSPISDTTVLSSVACASDHVDHVRTQAPYAILAMTVALGAGYLPCTFLGTSPWMGMAVGCAVLFAVVRFLGKKADDETPEPDGARAA